MKGLTFVYIKMFLVGGLTFGIFMSVFEYVDRGHIAIGKQVILATLFGSVMTFIHVGSRKKLLRKHGITDFNESHFRVVQRDTVVSAKGIDEVAELIKRHPETKEWSVKREDGRLKISTHFSWFSWGESVMIEFGDGKINIQSRPSLRTSLYDAGKNLENILLLKEILGDQKIDK